MKKVFLQQVQIKLLKPFNYLTEQLWKLILWIQGVKKDLIQQLQIIINLQIVVYLSMILQKKTTFEKIQNFYLEELKEKGGNIRKIILLGNKADLKDKREVSSEDGVDLAEKNGFIFMESSALDNYNVSNAFETLIEMTNADMKKNNCQKIKKERKYEKKDVENKCC